METNATPLQQAKRPRTALAGPYGHPFHPILVTIPIGAWISSLIFALFALFGDDDEVWVQGSQLLIAIGVIMAVVAAIFGLMDLSVIPSGTPAKRTAFTHMALNLTVVALFVVAYIIQAVSGVDDLNIASFVLVILGLAILTVSGWLGGKLAYHYGVRVAAEETQVEGYR